MIHIEDYQFEVGDAVQFKTWDELADEFGTDAHGGIEAPDYFNDDMEYLCGQIVHIRTIDGRRFTTKEGLEAERSDGFDDAWTLNLAFVRPYDETQNDDEIEESEWEKILGLIDGRR